MPLPSIIARYLAREILQTTAAVTLILLLIFLSGRFAKYLVDAATGRISADIIFSLLLYRAPNILERILPLGLFLGILLVFGRLYVENEISVLHASGVSIARLLRASCLAIVPVSILTGVLTLYVSPAGFQRVESMLNNERRRSELDLIEAGKFLQLRARHGVIYTGEIGDQRKTMRDIFIASQHVDGEWTILRADSGFQRYDETLDERYLTLEKGARYSLHVGQAAGERLQFASLQQLMLPPDEFDPRKLKEDAMSTGMLFSELKDPAVKIVPGYTESINATLQWRFSLILLVPLVSILAVAMSRTTPRQGRYIKLLPAMLLYFAYMSFLDVLRHKIAENDWPIMPGMMVAHVLFLLLVVLILNMDRLKIWRRSV